MYRASRTRTSHQALDAAGVVAADRLRASIESPVLIATIDADMPARQPEDAGRFLSEASAVLAASLDYQTTLASIVRLAVPTLADLCTVYTAADGEITLVEAAQVDSPRGDLLRRLIAPTRLEPAAPHPIVRALRGGAPEIHSAVSADLLAALSGEAPSSAAGGVHPIVSYMTVPLKTGGRTLGALAFASTYPAHPYAPADLTLAEDLARRAALAVDNARLYEAERRARYAAEVAGERTAHLQALTAALSEALTPAQVAAVIVDQAVSAVHASSGYVALLREDGAEFEMLGSTGYSRRLATNWQRFRPNPGSPIADVVQTREAIWLETREDWNERYPYVSALRASTGDVASALLPLTVEGRVTGGIGLSFPDARSFSPEDRGFLLALARQCAQALERARLYEAERSARAASEAAQRRLAFLAEASAVLASSLDYALTLENVARLAVPALADWCFVDVAEKHGEVRRVAVSCADPDQADLALALRRYPPAPETPNGAAGALRSRRSELLPIVTDEFLKSATRDATHFRLARMFNPTSIMYVPLLARGRALGVLTLARTDPEQGYKPHDLTLAEDLARRAAVAVENALLHQQAQDALRIRDEFLASASHDLKTPLTTIRGMTQILQRRAERSGGSAGEATLEVLGSIESATNRMTGLVGELLDLTRLETGRPLDLQPESTDLVALARAVAAEHQRMTHIHRMKVEARVASLTGEWDAARLERALSNLIANAIRYSPAGGDVIVTVGRDSTFTGEEVATIVVQDEGLGIPATDLPHIFERFYRGANVTGKIVGTGIGLAGARQIIEQHGGSVRAASTEGKGSVFSVTLPLRPAS